jgi:multidrug efflux pump subunit AcrB
LDQVRASVADVTAYVSGIDGVYGLRSNAYETETLSLEFDDVLMARAGLNRVDVAMTVRDALQGRVAAEFSDNFLLYDVRVDAGDQDIMTFFKTFRCKNMQGNWIDLSAVSRLKRVKSVNVISHYNYSREMTVIADVNSELITSKALNKRVQGYVDERLANAYPDLFFSLEGEESERRASLDSLWKGFAVVVGVIFLLLVFLFQSIHYSFLILLCIPFSLVSVVWVFFLHQEVLSFFALLGMVALTGVIVNDSIIMVDYLKKERQNEVSNGVDVSQTVLMAAKARLRPIVLTSITTFVGILPTA